MGVGEIELPVVRVGPEGALAGLAEARRGLRETGAMFVEVGGLRDGFARRKLEAASRLFASGRAALQGVQMAPGSFRGYIAPLRESGSRTLHEIKEGFSYGMPRGQGAGASRAPANPLEAENLWPRGLAQDAQEELEDLFVQLGAVSWRLVEGLFGTVDGLGSLPDMCRNGARISLMRVFHYLGTGSAAYESSGCQSGNCTGSSPHTDWGLLTLILSDDLDMLHFQINGTWVRAKPASQPAADSVLLVANVGDYLALASRGALVSPVHRVGLGAAERTSFVYFFYPDFDARIPDIAGVERFLSLTQDQAGGAGHVNQLAGADLRQTFGQLILDKWGQVYRDEAADWELTLLPFLGALLIIIVGRRLFRG